MTEISANEKAKQECWAAYWASTKIKMHGDAADFICNDIFNFVFDRAYQLGNAHYTDSSISAHGKNSNGILTPRMMIASMAMQGMLANGQSNSTEFIAKRAVSYADALLAELNKEKE